MLQEATESWQQELQKAANSYSESIENGELFSKLHTLYNSRPASFVSDYESAILQFEFEVRDVIDITLSEFECFVADKWDWQRTALANKYFSAALTKYRT